ncbi:MAG: Ig-like domain-containing protein [Treponema sp.]|nr:Ig-like domain-containing protein [Treponema sp.]
MPKSGQVLKANNSAELLSYIINQTPILKENIDLPVQGQSIVPIGKIIINNERYKNAFLNTVNLIGLTVITRNSWDTPWEEFTDKGTLAYGQQIREVITDIANVYDYNESLANEEGFIDTVVPNVMSYIHTLNFQKYYKTTTSDAQMAMAFENDDLFGLIDDIINSLYEGLKYDKFLVNKYMLARRILDGTVRAIQIPNFANLTDREVVAFVKGYSNKMTFRSPNYNPAGIRKATKFEDQFTIVSSVYDGKYTTSVLATSYFMNEAQMKANYALTDDFGDIDSNRLAEIFAKRDATGAVIPGEYTDGYVPLTSAELTALAEVPMAIVGRDFFQNYAYAFDNGAPEKATEFFNPQTLKTNHWLHYWGCFSTSPYENCICFTQTAQGVTSVTVNPSTATLSRGGQVKLSATVVTTGFANKAVKWSSSSEKVTVNQEGLVSVASDATTGNVTITATSVYDNTVTGTATITVA